MPKLGLLCGVLHEVVAAAHGDKPATLGFLFALTALALRHRPGPVIFVASRSALTDFGQPYGHGLRQLGLDVGRLVVIETRTDKDALWAMEECLRSQAQPAMVAGAIGSSLNLTMGRRLNLAAAVHRLPLMLLRSPLNTGASAAATRWRIGAAPAARDRFGAFAHWRWNVSLERCRNGRPGQWLLEWDHVSYRFRLAQVVVDRSPVEDAGFRLAG